MSSNAWNITLASINFHGFLSSKALICFCFFLSPSSFVNYECMTDQPFIHSMPLSIMLQRLQTNQGRYFCWQEKTWMCTSVERFKLHPDFKMIKRKYPLVPCGDSNSVFLGLSSCIKWNYAHSFLVRNHLASRNTEKVSIYLKLGKNQ